MGAHSRQRTGPQRKPHTPIKDALAFFIRMVALAVFAAIIVVLVLGRGHIEMSVKNDGPSTEITYAFTGS